MKMRLKPLAPIFTLLISAYPVLAEEQQSVLVKGLRPTQASPGLRLPSAEIGPTGTAFVPLDDGLGIKINRPYIEWQGAEEESLNKNTDDVQDIDEYCKAPNSYLLTMELEDAAKNLDWTQCYSGKIISSQSSLPAKDILKNDQSICECLRGFSKVPAVAKAMELVQPTGKDLLQFAQKEQNEVLNGIMFQSFNFSKNQKLTESFANVLLKDKQYTTLNFEANFSLVSDKESLPPGQCLHPKMYLAKRQMPNEFIRSALNRPFVEHEWDFRSLEGRYQQLMKMSLVSRLEHKAEIQHIKEKLKYLNRNPVLKYAFAIDGKDYNEASKLKLDLFRVIQGNLQDPMCEPGSQCYTKYRNSVSKLLFRPELVTPIRKVAREDVINRARRKNLQNTSGKMSGEPTPKSVISEFKQKFNLPGPEECSKQNRDDLKCIQIFGGYCKTLDNYAAEIEGLTSDASHSAVYDDIDAQMENDFNIDLAKNEDYRRANDEYCNTSRKQNLLSFGGPSQATFNEFIDHVCKDKKFAGCERRTVRDMALLRTEYEKSYSGGKSHRSALGNVGFSLECLQSLAQSQSDEFGLSDGLGQPEQMNLNNKELTDQQLAALLGSAVDRGDSGLAEFRLDTTVELSAESNERPFMTDFGQALANNMASSQSFSSDPYYEELPVYSSSYVSPTTSTAAVPTETPKIEEMPEEKRRELLSDWQSEYEEWRRKVGTEMTPAQKAEEEQLRQEIATLRALLDQQKQLSEQQFKLLNEALAARSKPQADTVVAPQEDSKSKPKAKSSSKFAAAKAVVDEVSDAGRAPASIKDIKQNTSGALGGAASASTSSSSRKSSSSDSSRESVAREEAKLVNLKRYSDGSITIETANHGASGGNAITIPVSDEQYRMLQANPQGLNLNQLVKTIPQEKIAQLEKSGEIVILLQNGSNPPFEVKVAKQDNRLIVLSDKNGKAQAPVRRVYTREALTNELKAQR